MIRKETRIINGREAHLYYDEERQAYLVASDLMEVFLGLYENKDKPVNQLAEESNLTPCYLGSPCEYQRENAKMPMEYWNNGWIPCSERLPSIEEVKEWATFLATIRVNGKYDIMDFCLFGTDGKWVVSSNKEVIAWKRQMPYQPKE